MEISSALVNEFISENTDSRIDTGERCTAESARDIVEKWHSDGSFVVANAGAYDIMGLNHLRGLIQARIIGAAYKLGDYSKPSEIYELASSDDIKLIVSLDTNGAIEENKSFKEASGQSVRPVLDWETRARTLALQSFGGTHNLVDYITKHGPNACSVCANEGCAHSSAIYNIASSGADLTILKAYNQATFDRYRSSRFHVIDESEGAFFDKLLDSQISTTALVRRIKLQEGQV